MLETLAPKARAWNDVIAVDSALIDRAPTTEKRVELLRRKAQTIEEQLKDAPRAFRTHLIALLPRARGRRHRPRTCGASPA